MRLLGMTTNRLVTWGLWGALFAQAFVAIAISSPWLTGDSQQYLNLASSLTQGRYGEVLANGFEPDVMRPPGYPIILASLSWVPHAVIVSIQAGLCLTSFYLIQRHLERSEVNPNLFLAVCVIYPFPMMYSVQLMAEAWTILALTVVALLLDRPLSKRSLITVGVICGLAALLRSDLLLIPMFIAAFVFINRRAWIALLPVIAAGLVVLPYAVWNYATFGKFSPVPLASAMGTSLYYATWMRKVPQEDLEALWQEKTTPVAIRSGLIGEVSELNRSIGARQLTAPWSPGMYTTGAMRVRSAQVFGAKAIERIKADPAHYARYVTSNLWYLWNTSRYPPVPGVALLKLVSAVVFLAGIGGIALAILGRLPVGWGPAVIVAYPLAVHVFLHTEARYTASVRPLLMMYAALFLGWVFQSAMSLRRRRLDRAAP